MTCSIIKFDILFGLQIQRHQLCQYKLKSLGQWGSTPLVFASESEVAFSLASCKVIHAGFWYLVLVMFITQVEVVILSLACSIEQINRTQPFGGHIKVIPKVCLIQGRDQQMESVTIALLTLESRESHNMLQQRGKDV